VTATSLAPTVERDPRERVLVGALAFTEIVSWGVLYYAFGVLVEPMQAELGWSQGLLGGAFSLALLVSALLAVPIGRALARRGARIVMTAGSCAAAALVYAWSHVESPLALYVLFLALGFPLASTLYEAGFAALIGRFGSGRRTDVALLVLTIVAGTSLGVYLVPIVLAQGFRPGFAALAGACSASGRCSGGSASRSCARATPSRPGAPCCSRRRRSRCSRSPRDHPARSCSARWSSSRPARARRRSGARPGRSSSSPWRASRA
jgi:MFS family permease